MRALRSPWIAGIVLMALGAALMIAALGALGFDTAPLVFGLLIGAGLVTAGRRLRAHRRARRTPGRPRPRVLAGGKVVTRSYDLRQDSSTDNQRWLM